MNVLVIHEVDYQRKVVFEFHNLAELLSTFGHKVFVVDYPNSWRRDHRWDWGTLRTATDNGAQRAYQEAQIILKRPGFIKIPGLSRLSAFFTHYFAIERLIEAEGIEAILLYSVPTNGLQTLRLARKHRIPVFFRSIDILHQLAPGLLKYPTLLIEGLIYRNADKILALTPKLGEYTVRLGAKRDKVELLLPGVDLRLFGPAQKDKALMARWGIAEDDKIILFVGTLFEFCGMDEVMRNMGVIAREIPRAKLLIVGGGPLLVKLKAIVTGLGLQERVIFTGFEPYEWMPRYINLADVCLNPFRICGATAEIIPTKLLQYLACGKPLVATPLPGTVDILPGREQGVVYADSSQGLVSEIIELLKNDDQRDEIGNNGYRYVKLHHDWMIMARKLEEIILKNVSRGH